MTAEELKQLIEQCKQIGTRYEELFSFVCDLRRADFKISTPQLIAVQKLIVALARSGENPIDFARLKTFIAPLVCSSPEEQTAFYHHFDQWLETHQPPVLTEVAAAISHEQPPAPTNSASEKEVSQSWWQTRAFKAAISLTGLLIVAALFFYYSPEQKTFAGIVRDKETKKPLGNAQISFGEKIYQSNESGQFSFTYHSFGSNSKPLTVSRSGYQSLETTIEANQNRGEFILSPEKTVPPTPIPTVSFTPMPTPVVPQTVAQNFYEKYYPEILIAAALLPFVIYGIWLFWRWMRRKQLERWRDENQPDFRSLTLKDEGDFLYGKPTFRRTAQELRRHRRLETNTLDVAFTVEATVREGGLFKAVYAKRQVSPEYLVLIDQLGYRDHKSRLEDKILDRFEREGIFFECFYFNRDPRLCRPKIVSRKSKQPKYLNLRELSTQYPEHRLLIFSDGAGMIDKFSGRPFRWTRSLSEWEIRALLTPNSALEYDEWILEQEAGLPVLPAHEKDLKTLVEIIRTGELPKIKSYAENTNYPRTLTEDFEQWWLRRVRPRVLEDEDDKAEILRIELRYYLGADGYFLLCACAVYPELAPDLTFYLAHRFIAPDRRETVLESLVCLPWFRQSAMPDWLREDLLKDLTFEQETEVRQTIEYLLSNYIKNPTNGFNLEIAAQKNEDDIGFWKRRKLHEVIKTEPENSPLRDYVFLKFVSANKLAVALPRKLSRFLEKQTATRFAFLRRFYEFCANAVKSIGNLWQTLYRRNLIDGISNRKSILVPLFTSLIVVGILSLLPPNFSLEDIADGNQSNPDTPYPSVLLDEPPQTNSKNLNANQFINSNLLIGNKSVNMPIRTETMPDILPTTCEVGQCCDSLTANDGYIIASVWTEDRNEKRTDLTNYDYFRTTYIGKSVYTSQVAKNIGGDVIDYFGEEEVYRVTGYCPKILPPSECSNGKCISLDIFLIPEFEGIKIRINVTDEETNQPITNGQIAFLNENSLTPHLKGLGGNIILEPGNYTVTTSSPGYVANIQTIWIDEKISTFSVSLKKNPTTPQQSNNTSTPTPTDTPLPKAKLIDEYSSTTEEEIKRSLDYMRAEMSNDPNARVVIYIYDTPAKLKNRNIRLKKFLNDLRVDMSRIAILQIPDSTSLTRIYLVPAGADEPSQ